MNTVQRTSCFPPLDSVVATSLPNAPRHVAPNRRVERLIAGAAIALAGCVTLSAHAQAPIMRCDTAGIGAARLEADGPPVTVLEVSTGTAGEVPYCLVKVLVPRAINIWVALPMAGQWNGRWQSVGGGVYAGQVSVPTDALRNGYAGATTDTGHATSAMDGKFGMLEPGKRDEALQIDFAYRSEHLMAVLGKQLVKAFYGKEPEYSYWNGCSTGGRQGLRMAQDFPDDYDGVLAGAPAIHWDRFQAGHLWYWIVQQEDNGGPIGGGTRSVLAQKQALATNRAVAACDALDAVSDGVLDDPRSCRYSAAADITLTSSMCTAADGACLTPTEAAAVDKMWQGPVQCVDGSGACDVPEVAARDLDAGGNLRLWYGLPRGADLSALGGPSPFAVAIEQARYWVYFDPSWDPGTVDFGNYPRFFRDTVRNVGPIMASDDPDLDAFRQRGGKLILWHGWADPLINAEGTIDYYERVATEMRGLGRTQEFARLFMAPGVAHCGGGNGPQPQGVFEALVKWVEHDDAPETILAARQPGRGNPAAVPQTRPLCPYPAVARWTGQGSTDDAANFSCKAPEER